MVKSGIEQIAQEREEQQKKHGRTIQLDVLNNDKGQLAEAAYVLLETTHARFNRNPPMGWDQQIWDRMLRKPREERLIISGALIAAEIDRLEALKEQKSKG